MTKITRTLSLAALACAAMSTVSLAQPGPGGQRPDANASVTRADAQARAAEMFARMDANKDGKLDAADRAARESERFARLDANKDGSISQDEFAAAHKQRAGGGEGRRGGEGKHMGRRGPGGPGGKAGPGMMLRMADTNKDRTVTKDEFLAAQAKHFDMMDANKDGTVTGDERKAARAKMREHMSGMRAKAGQPDKAGHEGH